ncbi:MAG: amino acid adenylation domain-containing protein [Clostridiales bacterium]|nr:amino acid adenylation domain-containing protein [Clostridiales bacterium]
MTYTRITDYLDETASRLPDKAAYVDSNRAITFREIRDEAYKLAGALAESGVFKKPVGIFLDQCAEVVPSIMGVAYAGNFYSILDVDMPEARIDKILETFEPAALITSRKFADKAESILREYGRDVKLVIYEDEQEKPLTGRTEAIIDLIKEKVVSTDLLYVLFTSGSTGIPKGVAQSHGAVMAEVEWLPTTVCIDEDTVFANQAPFYFVMSTLEVFQTVKNGCTTYIPPRMAFAFPGMLMEFLIENKVNTVYWVPTLLCMFANMGALEEEELPPLRLVMASGEVMPVKQLNMWMDAFPDAVFVNQYGPTEMADICAYYIVDRRFKDTESLPIGRACEHMDLIILNENDEEAAPGEEGELCGRGPSLAYGYYNNPEKTAEVFVQNPLVSAYEEKIYRSGDLVRLNERGELIYVTRKDFQIKHMGHRIELGEIETAASSLEGMERCACVYDDVRKMIVMFCTGSIEEDKVIEGVRALVPEYMVPSKVIKMDVLPLNLNGKIDRKGLKGLLSQ